MTQTDNEYCILNPKKDIVLPEYPTEYWILHLLIIILKQELNSEHPLLETGNFLVLEHPSYASHNKSIWSTPYSAYRINIDGAKKYNKSSDIINMYKEECRKKTKILKYLTDYRFYHMGISNWELEIGKEYIEYKRSTRQPGVWKCYYIKEHFVYNIDDLGLKNIIDTEDLHSYNYLPINQNTNNTTLYGKPLSTNIVNLLDDAGLLQNAKIENIDSKIFRTKHNGYMLKFDIVSFTKTYQEIENGLFKSFVRTGAQYAEDFLLYLQQIFEQELMKINISQYKFEGDGFFATIQEEKVNLDVTNRIIDAFKEISKRITTLLRSEIKLSYRASLIFGEYNYGKELGLFSKELVHSGKELIRLARADSAIREHISQNEESTPSIFFLIESSLCNEDNFSDKKLSYVKEVPEFRKTDIKGKLLSIKMEDVL